MYLYWLYYELFLDHILINLIHLEYIYIHNTIISSESIKPFGFLKLVLKFKYIQTDTGVYLKFKNKIKIKSMKEKIYKHFCEVPDNRCFTLAHPSCQPYFPHSEKATKGARQTGGCDCFSM